MNRVDFCELNSIDFENSIMKNTLIRSTDGEWIWFIDSNITDRTDIEPILQENDFLAKYDVVLFCSEDLDGEIGLSDLLVNPQCGIYAFGVKRHLLIKTGSFNQLLKGNNNYEFLLRAAEAGSMYAVSCSAEKEAVFEALTMAYIIRRYMPKLKNDGILNEVFMYMVQMSGCHGKNEKFNEVMNDLLQDAGAYNRIEENTAPILLFVGNDLCAGILADFAHSMADELVALGQAVITTDGRYGDYGNIPTDILLNQNYKAIIGFQTPAFQKEMFQKMKGKKIQFWFDNPIFFADGFEKSPKDMFYLCQDAYYADFIKKYYGIHNAIQFPPGGNVVENISSEKKYDVVFVGNYEPLPKCIYDDEFEKNFFEFMLLHPDYTFEQGVYNYGKEQGKEYGERELFANLQRLKGVCLDILHRDRHYTVEKIVSAGIKLHVFSENWEMYQGKGRENLIIHPMIFGEEPFRVWAQSKIGLNIMRGHKAGMTERIANIMLCGTCCLSDETVYLREHFTDGEDIVLYKRSELDELPNQIRYLLEHGEERERIALAGHERAMKEHTWRMRAEQLLELIDS